jgi:Rha family phage regulatory protein
MNASNLVYLKDAKGMTDSLTIAREFDKQHKHVLEKIHACKGELPEEFGRSNFRPSSYINDQNKEQPKYELTRDGFMFLVMGFNGKKAATVKILFIEEFNRMESKLIDVGLQAKPRSIEDLLREATEMLAQTHAQLVTTQATVIQMSDNATSTAKLYSVPAIKIPKLYPVIALAAWPWFENKYGGHKTLKNFGPAARITMYLKEVHKLEDNILIKELVNVKGLQSQKERALYNKADLDRVETELKEIPC